MLAVGLILCAGLVQGTVYSLDNTNYLQYIGNSTQKSVAVVCMPANGRSKNFAATWNDLAMRFGRQFVFAVCDSSEASEFLAIVQPESLPAIFVLNVGVVYHLYEEERLGDFIFLRDYLLGYSRLSHKVTNIPAEIMNAIASGKEVRVTRVAEPVPKREDAEVPKPILSSLYEKAAVLVLTDGNSTADYRDVITMFWGIMLAPMGFGLAFLLAGLVASWVGRPAKTKSE